MKLKLILLITILSLKSFSQQELKKEQLDSLPKTVKNLFIKLSGNSKKWNNYKLITHTDFVSFQKEVLDSVSVIKKNAVNKQETINKLNTKIVDLDKKINSLKENLNELKSAKNKQNRTKGLIWGLIASLAIGLAYFIYKFNNSNSVTKITKKKFEELESEFENHRKKALENEQKLRRKLQDEINKQRGV